MEEMQEYAKILIDGCHLSFGGVLEENFRF